MKIKVSHMLTMTFVFAVGVTLGVLFQQYFLNESQRTTPRPDRENIPEEIRGKLQLFILAGQSNMSGWGDLPRPGVTPDPRIYVFGNDYHWKLAQDPIDDPSNQVDMVSLDAEAGFGPALPFAAAILQKYPDIAIGLIPCAKGNSSIYEWRRSLGDDTLYGSCLKRIRAASTMGRVAGILFFQGEADALDPKQNRRRTLMPDEWADQFAVLVDNWRTDLDSPELSVVFAQIGGTTAPENYPNWSTVQQQQEAVQLPFVAMITTKDLAPDAVVHFTTEGYEIIGKRFAEAYLRILEWQ